MIMRIGHGYDVHRLANGRKLIIGGVNIPFDRGLDGHSDADVLLHALCDAMLGAAALGDIGKHFPPSDTSFRDMDSRFFLRQVNQLVTGKNYTVSNVDLTLVAEAPKMAPYIPQMVSNIGSDLAIDDDQVNIKATTTEGLGFCGIGEGMACHAVVLLNRD